MQPTPSKFKKFLVPGALIVVIIVTVIAIGFYLNIQNNNLKQDASVYKAQTLKQSPQGVGVVASPSGQLLCLGNIPKIKIMSPNGGEVFQEGDIIRVTYQGCNIPHDQLSQLRLSFEYVPDNGQPASPWSIIETASISPAIVPGYQTFNIPNNYTPPGFIVPGVPFGKHFTIRMSAGTLSSPAVGVMGSSGTYNVIANDSSDGLFTIKEH